MRDVISTCPVCEHELAVTRLHCRECGTTLEGEFSVGRFSRLSRDQMRVLESFLRSRGNLKEMERDLGLSYPTVRGRVDTLVRALGLVPLDGRGADDIAPERESPVATERRRILESLARHEIDAEAAAAALRRLSAGTASPAVVETAASATADPPAMDEVTATRATAAGDDPIRDEAADDSDSDGDGVDDDDDDTGDGDDDADTDDADDDADAADIDGDHEAVSASGGNAPTEKE